MGEMNDNAAEELSEAIAEYSATPSPETKTRADAAVDRFLQWLRPVVGERLAAKYDHAWTTFRMAVEREAALHAQLASGGAADDTDAQFVMALNSESQRAMKVLEEVGMEVMKALDAKGEA